MKNFTNTGKRFVAPGDRHWAAKFTDREVETIRELHTGGMSRREIMDKFGMSKANLSKLLRYLIR